MTTTRTLAESYADEIARELGALMLEAREVVGVSIYDIEVSADTFVRIVPVDDRHVRVIAMTNNIAQLIKSEASFSNAAATAVAAYVAAIAA